MSDAVPLNLKICNITRFDFRQTAFPVLSFADKYGALQPDLEDILHESDASVAYKEFKFHFAELLLARCLSYDLSGPPTTFETRRKETRMCSATKFRL